MRRDSTAGQKRLAAIMLLLIAICVALIAYQRYRASFVEVALSATATKQDLASAAMRYKSMSDAQAAAVRDSTDAYVKAELVFTGMGDREQMSLIAAELASWGMNPVFYVTSQEAAHNAAGIEPQLQSGLTLGLLGNGIGVSLEGDGLSLTDKLCRACVLLRGTYGVACRSLLTDQSPGADALRAAGAVGIEEVVVARTEIDLRDCVSLEAARTALERVPRYSIVRVRLEPGDGRTVRKLQYLLSALEETDLQKQAEQLLDAAEKLPTAETGESEREGSHE